MPSYASKLGTAYSEQPTVTVVNVVPPPPPPDPVPPPAELVLDNFDRVVAQGNDPNISPASSGYNWTWRSVVEPALASVSGSYIRFYGPTELDGIEQPSLDLGVSYIIPANGIAGFELRFRTSIVTDGTSGETGNTLEIAVEGNLVDLMEFFARIASGGLGGVECNSNLVSKTDWVVNSWYTARIEQIGETDEIGLKLWRDESESMPGSYLAQGPASLPWPDDDSYQVAVDIRFDYRVTDDPLVRHTVDIDYIKKLV